MKRSFIIYLLFSILLTTFSCGGSRYAATEKVYKKKSKVFAADYKTKPVHSQLEKIAFQNKEWIASTNFGVRRPNYVMIHHTAQNSLDQTVKTFHNQKVGVSSHYVIGRDGKIVQMVNDLFRAHHAGAGKWGNDTDLNSSSIGIELDNNGTTDPWPDIQIEALLQLLTYLKTTYRIPQGNFIGHMDYAPGRKIDPSRFPWKTLAEEGFGYWYDQDLSPAPEHLDVRLALKIIGYNVDNLPIAIRAFKQHYIQDSNTDEMTEDEKAILYNIMLKYL